MATSGTVGLTTISTASLLDHAVRRCGKRPEDLSPELIDSALESLFILLTHLANRGLNLWRVQSHILGLTEDKGTYALPTGTQSLLNVLYSIPTRAEGTDSSDAQNYQTELDEATRIVRVGVKFAVSPTTSFSIESSDDGITWDTLQAITDIPVAGAWGWYDLDPVTTAQFFRVTTGTALTVDTFYLATQVRETTTSPLSRDEWSQQPDKYFSGKPSTNYFFEKLIDPQMTLWPLPNNSYDQIVVWVHRQVEDVGSLSQELAIPDRWFEAILTHLAARLSLELPAVEAPRIKLLQGLADKMVIEAEFDETDGSPVYLAPRIGAYTA